MGFAPIPAVTEPSKVLGPPTVVFVLRTLDNLVGVHNLYRESIIITIPGYYESIKYYYYRPERQNTLPHKSLMISKWEADILPRPSSLLGLFLGYHL
jgi:hypothetical protein